MTERFVVGRDREIAQLDLAIGHGTDGLRLAMLSGPSGLGKTTLAHVALDRAADRGFETITIRGRAGSLSTPFAPIIEALPALEALLLLTSNADSDAEQCGMALVQLVAELAQDKPQLIVIDDAQALDESTIAVLGYLSGMAESTNLTLLFVEQTDAIGIPDSYRSYVEGLLARRVVSHLQLGPMGDDGLGLIVAHELGLDSIDENPAGIVERADGNPWFARELAQSWKRGSKEIPVTIAAAATSRLHSLDTVGQDIVSTIGICPEGAHIAWLEAMSGQSPRHFVRTMEAVQASGMIREDGDVLTIAHPLMQQAIVDELSAALKRAIHIELVEAMRSAQLDPVVTARACAYHLAQSGRRDEAVASYLEAAGTSQIIGKFHEARADFLAALEIETDVERRITTLRRVAMLATQLGSTDAPSLWQDLGRLAASSHNDALYSFALYQAFAASRRYEPEYLRRAAALDIESNGWSAMAAGSICFEDNDYEQAIAHCDRAVAIANETDDQLLHATALRMLGFVYGESGDPSRAIDASRSAIDAFIALRVHHRAIQTWGSLILALVDDQQFAAAQEASEAGDQYVVDLGLDQHRPFTLAYRAYVLSEIGDFERAHELIGEAAGLDASFRNNPTYWADSSVFIADIRSKIANDVGAGNAFELATSGAQIADESNCDNGPLQAAYELYRAMARRDGVERALSQIADLEKIDEPIYVTTAAVWTLRQSVLTDSAAGVERIREIRTNYGKWDAGARVQLFRDEIDAVLKVVDGGDPIALNEIANRWSEAGCALDALKVNAMSGAFLVRRGDKEAAKTFLQTAKNGLQTCGASGDADLVAALLRQTGARSRAKSRTTSVGPLTKRELEIARLVASGLKNSEVAGTLFLAEKTVAAHLSNIYGKVEVRSRVQLGQWIRENDTEFDTALVG